MRAQYAQVRLTSARLAADAHDCSTALSMLDALRREESSLPFTAGGLADTLRPPVMSEQVAAVEWTCGRKQSAQARWSELSRALIQEGAPVNIAVADRARQRLGRARTGAERARLERALDAATNTLETGGTSGPGLVEYARASLLSALGRRNESRQAYRRVFLYPDRGLSHALARAAMRAPSSPVAR